MVDILLLMCDRNLYPINSLLTPIKLLTIAAFCPSLLSHPVLPLWIHKRNPKCDQMYPECDQIYPKCDQTYPWKTTDLGLKTTKRQHWSHPRLRFIVFSDLICRVWRHRAIKLPSWHSACHATTTSRMVLIGRCGPAVLPPNRPATPEFGSIYPAFTDFFPLAMPLF